MTGFSSKRRAEQTKNALKEGGSKPYNVRIVPYDGGYYLYTAPRVTREDSQWLIQRIGGL